MLTLAFAFVVVALLLLLLRCFLFYLKRMFIINFVAYIISFSLNIFVPPWTVYILVLYFYSILQGSPLNKQNSLLDCLPNA